MAELDIMRREIEWNNVTFVTIDLQFDQETILMFIKHCHTIGTICAHYHVLIKALDSFQNCLILGQSVRNNQDSTRC